MNIIVIKIKKATDFLLSINIKNSKPRIDKSDLILFLHDNDYNLVLNNKAYSALMDSVREDLENYGWKCQTINHPFSRLQGNLTYSNAILRNRRYFFALIKDFAFKILTSSKQPIYKKSYYQWLLKESGATCVIAIGANSALCLAAKQEKVPCVELLHGIGYDPIPWGWESLEKEKLPDGILSLDKKSTETLSPLQAKGIKTLQIPHPFLKKFHHNKKNLNLPIEWQPSATKNHKIILISLQWGYDNIHPKLNGIIRNHIVLDEIINSIKSLEKKDISFAFRLHPVQLKEKKYKHHVEFISQFCEHHPNTQWQWFTEMPLPVVLQHCAGHITMSSMSSYEAAYMGVKTLALCPTLRKGGYYQNMFSDLEEAGYLTKAQADTQSILEWVDAVQPTQPFLDNLADEEAWEQAVEWMLGSRYKNDKEKA